VEIPAAAAVDAAASRGRQSRPVRAIRLEQSNDCDDQRHHSLVIDQPLFRVLKELEHLRRKLRYVAF
jgi:hypothetical protein